MICCLPGRQLKNKTVLSGRFCTLLCDSTLSFCIGSNRSVETLLEVKFLNIVQIIMYNYSCILYNLYKS